nr:MAG TPA: hypothetical protein [Caudoviricetes sp.]
MKYVLFICEVGQDLIIKSFLFYLLWDSLLT